jgi:hypothetical protein
MGGMTQAVNNPANKKALMGTATFDKKLKRIVVLLHSNHLQKSNESFDLHIGPRLNCSSKDETTFEMFLFTVG